MVSYIKNKDLESSIRDLRLEHINDNVTEDNQTDSVQVAMKQAMGIVKNYLSRFDLATEFAKIEGADPELDPRNLGLVNYIKNITLYFIYSRVESDIMPDIVLKNYNDTIADLQEISKGKMSMDLELKKIDSDGDGIEDAPKTKFIWGGNEPRTY